MYQMAVIYSKWPKEIPTFYIPKPSENFPNWDFGFGNIASGNPAVRAVFFAPFCLLKNECSLGASPQLKLRNSSIYFFSAERKEINGRFRLKVQPV
jgi:hypothetical protein